MKLEEKIKKKTDETQFPQRPGNFVAAKHFRIGQAACGFTRRWGNEVYTKKNYTVDLRERVIYDRQVLLTLFALLNC